jgi:hypothetical protein
MHWVILAIALFVGLYTFVNISHRKEDGARLPYEESRVRGGHELREVGWRPFPNAYGLPGDGSDAFTAPYPIEAAPFEILERQDERVSGWTDRLPPLEQGEQLDRLAAPAVVPAGQPYLAHLFWDAPEDFRPPQLVVFRQENRILIVPRPPERFARGSTEQTVFIIPPEFIEAGEYEVFLSTEGRVNRWTFRAE